jgi:hypothetical protein
LGIAENQAAAEAAAVKAFNLDADQRSLRRPQ